MASIEASIEAALFVRMAAFTSSPAVTITGLDANADAAFEPGADTKYLRVEHIPNNVERPFIGSVAPERYFGMLQVTVVGPKANVNPIVYTDLAGQVAAWFPTDLDLYRDGRRVRITKAPVVDPRVDSSPFWNVPVTIDYEAFI